MGESPGEILGRQASAEQRTRNRLQILAVGEHIVEVPGFLGSLEQIWRNLDQPGAIRECIAEIGHLTKSQRLVSGKGDKACIPREGAGWIGCMGHDRQSDAPR